MLNTKLRIAELDFDKIKSNLKLFLKDQSEFSDYDFDGSGLSVLMDILAYNTHYNSYYLNMIANEMFLDSVTQRDSAVSIAKHLGYVTKSASASESIVKLTITATEPNNTGNLPTTIDIPQYSKFTTKIDNKTYVFHTLDSYTASIYTPVSGSPRTFTLSGVKIKEGIKGNITYVVNESGFEEKYIIPVRGVDTSSIVVKVRDDATDTTTDIYKLYDSVDLLDDTSKIYFLQEVENEYYEIYFGDGVLGKKVSQGNIINIDYLTTNGADANGAGSDDGATPSFTFSSALSYPNQDSSPTVVVSVESIATGGVTLPESVDSIKFNAPKSFQTQGRAVTIRDYKSIVLSKYSNAESVIVWGGEDNIPEKQFGKVFISIKPVTGLVLNQAQKDDLKLILDKYKVLTITPEIVTPDYLFATVNCVVRYDSGTSLHPEETIKSKVIDTIKNYNKSYLGNFESIFRYSQLVGLIDDTDDSIRSNMTTLKLKKRIKVPSSDLGKKRSHSIQFNNSLVKDISGFFQGTSFNAARSSETNTEIGLFYSDPFNDSRSELITLGGTAGTSFLVADTNLTTTQVRRDNITAVQIVDNGRGGLNLVKEYDKSIYNPGDIIEGGYGTVNYVTGEVEIPSMEIGNEDGTSGLILDSEYLYFHSEALETDIFPSFNQVVTILDSDIQVTMVKDTI